MAEMGLRWWRRQVAITRTRIPMSKPAVKRVAKAGLPRPRAAQPHLPTKATSSKDGKQSPEKTSKQARIIELLRAPDGTSVAAVMKCTGWQQHSVRGFLAGVVRKKLGLKLSSETKDGVRLYRIIDDQTGSTGPSKRKRAR